MPEFVTSFHRSKLPEFAVFPFTKHVLEEVLRDIPQASIAISFFAWRSDKTFGRKSGKGRGMKVSRKDADTDVFSAHYFRGEWTIWVFPVRNDKEERIKELLHKEGFERLREWFLEKAPIEDPRSTGYESPSHLNVEFDGQKLLYRLTG
ncbi:MAG: hypothetical protein C0507_07635 [Cyanobacteria bacterium PR.3.49]|nr:hypothetical protein [Cyanobacteria bacterium PR.3.49]